MCVCVCVGDARCVTRSFSLRLDAVRVCMCAWVYVCVCVCVREYCSSPQCSRCLHLAQHIIMCPSTICVCVWVRTYVYVCLVRLRRGSLLLQHVCVAVLQYAVQCCSVRCSVAVCDAVFRCAYQEWTIARACVCHTHICVSRAYVCRVHTCVCIVRFESGPLLLQRVLQSSSVRYSVAVCVSRVDHPCCSACCSVRCSIAVCVSRVDKCSCCLSLARPVCVCS